MILIIADSIILIFSIWLSFAIRLDKIYLPFNIENKFFFIILFVAIIIAIPIFNFFGLYRSVIRFLGKNIIWISLKSAFIYSVILGLIIFLLKIPEMPRSIMIINFLLVSIMISGIRYFASWLFTKYLINSKKQSKNKKNVLIFGAGVSGKKLATNLQQNNRYNISAFVDNNSNFQGRDLMGIPILSEKKLQNFININNIHIIFLAVPTISIKDRNAIINRLSNLSVRIMTIPSIDQLSLGIYKVNDIQELNIDDLIGRERITPNNNLLSLRITNKVVLVSGGGGSIGSEICLQVIKYSPKILIILELNENMLYQITQNLEQLLNKLKIKNNNKNLPNTQIIPLLGSVTDEERVIKIIEKWLPNTIYHAAAYKHVPILEQNLSQGIKNNIFGTLTLSKVALLNNVENFILISSDKAVNPTNLMGASKRVAEIVLQSLSEKKKIKLQYKKKIIEKNNTTNFAIVRFGNVLESSGSVVPLFRKQIKDGGPLTVTHRQVTRYFMNIEEAAELVIQAGSMSKDINNAEVFLLDMGNPIKIYDLAKKMILFAGLTVKNEVNTSGDIKIKIIGLRPGEKLYEELLLSKNPIKTDHKKIYKAIEISYSWDKFSKELESLEKATNENSYNTFQSILSKLVTGYKPDREITDFLMQ